MSARAWRHPWQVVLCPYGVTEAGPSPVCSHRFEVTAEWCARARWSPEGHHFDVRRTPTNPMEPVDA